jgi:hypothetical protein
MRLLENNKKGARRMMQQKKTYIICPSSYLEHSAKGSTWRNHKYIKKENGRYYYDDSTWSSAKKDYKEQIKDGPVLSKSDNDLYKEYKEIILSGDEQALLNYKTKLAFDYVNIVDSEDPTYKDAERAFENLVIFDAMEEQLNSPSAKAQRTLENAFDKVKDTVVTIKNKITGK